LRKKVLVTADRGETRVAILEAEGKPEAKNGGSKKKGGSGQGASKPKWRVGELYIERRGSRSIVGNIYKGRVDNVLPGLEAAFVDIGIDKNGFLHADDVIMPGVELARRGRHGSKGCPTRSATGCASRPRAWTSARAARSSGRPRRVRRARTSSARCATCTSCTRSCRSA
jgi:hypothetical protein